MGLAPIGLTVYKRISFLQQCIESLVNNAYANDSELFIFSDAPVKGDEEVVSKLRNYLHTIKGFSNITIIERSKNGRVANNRGGQEQLLNEFGKMIWLAEDIITAPMFLKFMNGALEYYGAEKNVLSITGYCPSIKLPKDYELDYFALMRYNAWGIGIWKDKYDYIKKKISKNEYMKFLGNRVHVKAFKKNIGRDALPMLEREVKSIIDALDVRAMFRQFQSKQVTIYPFKSLVQNIGFDGSGVHCGVTDKFKVELLDTDKSFTFTKDISLDNRIVKANYKFRNVSLKTKLLKYISRW